MESLESKMDRLSPEQRKEVEDFVEFLLSRSGPVFPPLDKTVSIPPVLNVTTPSLSLIEPAHAREPGPVRLPDLARTGTRAGSVDESVSAPFQEINGGFAEVVSRDYMDYGQFDQHPSPATEAVRKVKRKILEREEQDKPRHLFDWVD
ncbi:MAG: hypothetical protein LUQ35_04970 [Methanoregula sp.]|jgi:hypothetical protein|nr:hypothetical protein [Methanoregula sp.]